MPDTDGFSLPPEQLRVLGALVEKQLTTPQQYPLTLNALTQACNQTSNRHPVVAYDESTTELAVRTLKQRGLTRFVHPVHGRSVLRYEHLLGDVLGVDRRQLAVLAVLLLRGPQTIGELRSRTERMVEFDDLAGVEHELDLLEHQAGGLVVSVPRRRDGSPTGWATTIRRWQRKLPTPTGVRPRRLAPSSCGRPSKRCNRR